MLLLYTFFREYIKCSFLPFLNSSSSASVVEMRDMDSPLVFCLHDTSKGYFLKDQSWDAIKSCFHFHICLVAFFSLLFVLGAGCDLRGYLYDSSSTRIAVEHYQRSPSPIVITMEVDLRGTSKERTLHFSICGERLTHSFTDLPECVQFAV